MRTFMACVEQDSETSLYVGVVPGISGAHTQASLDELQDNLREVLELGLEERGDAEDLPTFVGLQQVQIETWGWRSLPVVDARTLERVLLRLGSCRVRQKGSHVFYRTPLAGRPRFRITLGGTSPGR